MALAELIAKIGADTGGLDKGLASASSKIESFKAAAGAKLAGIFGVAAVASFTKSIMDMGLEINNASKRLGISTEAVQEWQYAARATGVEAEQLTTFFEKLGVAKEMALRGGQEGFQYERAFAKFGISIENLKKTGIEGLANKIAEVYKSGGNVQELAQPLRALAGEMAGRMVPAMTSGIEGFKKAAHDLGLVLSDELIKSAVDGFNELQDILIKLKNTAGPVLIPVFKSLADVVKFNLTQFDMFKNTVVYAAKISGRLGKTFSGEGIFSDYSKYMRSNVPGMFPGSTGSTAGGGSGGDDGFIGPQMRVKIPNNPELLKELRELTDSLIIASRPHSEVMKRLKGQRADQISIFNRTEPGSDAEIRSRIAIAKLDKEINDSSKQQLTPFKYGNLAAIGGGMFVSSQGAMIPKEQLLTLNKIFNEIRGFSKGGGF